VPENLYCKCSLAVTCFTWISDRFVARNSFIHHGSTEDTEFLKLFQHEFADLHTFDSWSL